MAKSNNTFLTPTKGPQITYGAMVEVGENNLCQVTINPFDVDTVSLHNMDWLDKLSTELFRELKKRLGDEATKKEISENDEISLTLATSVWGDTAETPAVKMTLRRLLVNPPTGRLSALIFNTTHSLTTRLFKESKKLNPGFRVKV
jgi:hypothetical protein